MPKKAKVELSGTIEFADGKIVTSEEFFAAPDWPIYEENNREFFHEAAMILDPTYAAKQRKIKRFEAVKTRREKLRLERERIDRELNGL